MNLDIILTFAFCASLYPPFLTCHLEDILIYWTHAYSNAESATGGVWLRRGKREGRFLYRICSAQWLLSLHISSVPFPGVSFSLHICPGSVSVTFVLSHDLMSDLRTHLVHNRCHTGSHILRSCLIPLPALCFPTQSFGFQLLHSLCSVFTPLFLLTASGICYRLRWVF